MKEYLYSAIYTLHSLNQGAQTWIAVLPANYTTRAFPYHNMVVNIILCTTVRS